MEKKEEVLRILSQTLRRVLKPVLAKTDKLQEIRLRSDQPLLLVFDNKEWFVTADGMLTQNMDKAYRVCIAELKETMEYISNYSLYAYEEEIKQGFLTILGGHRVGIAGKAIVEEGAVKSIRHISFINIRLSHQITGCANQVMPYICHEHEICHTLIISPPRCGKTTLLRDLIRQISGGFSGQAGNTVGVVDERSELGACYLGIPQNDLGPRTDVLDCCPKDSGMLMMIRSMSPQVIAVDEIGSGRDVAAIEYVMNCGCKLLATVHGRSMEELKEKPILGAMIQRRMFERYIVLNNHRQIGNVEEIYDERGSILYRGSHR